MQPRRQRIIQTEAYMVPSAADNTAAPAAVVSSKPPALKRRFPFSLEAEAACIGCMLIRNELSDEIFKNIGPSDFYDGRHIAIIEHILKYRSEKGAAAFDIVVLSEWLSQNNALTRAGGIPYINQLIDAAPSTFNIERYIEIVKRKSLLRKIIMLGEEMIENARGDQDPENVIDTVQRKAFELLSRRSNDYEHIYPIADRALDALEAGIGAGGFGIPSRYGDLDNIIIGLQPANLIIIGGRTGMGKTAFALNLALRCALSSTTAQNPSATSAQNEVGIPAGYFSLEMTKEDIAFRLLSTHGQIPLGNFKSRQVKEDRTWGAVLESIQAMKDVPIYIDDTPGISVNELVAKARRMVVKEAVRLIIVDYLQLIGGHDPRVNREQQISMVSKQLKNLARELKIPIIALTQLNRAVDQREDKSPRLSDIRESGAIEQDADLVLLLHRPAMDNVTNPAAGDNTQNEDRTELFIAKNRNGPTGKIELSYEGQFVRFVDYFS